MTDRPIIINNKTDKSDNVVIPFQVEGESIEASVRGRSVRLGTVLDQILSAHQYPPLVASTLGEVLVLTAMLGSLIKDEGTLTIQAKADGVIKLLVADFRAPDELRGYAAVDQEKLTAMGDNVTMEGLLGDGYLAITMDQGNDTERYQGIVELKGQSLADCAIEYFINSEQIPTALKLSAERDTVTGFWRGGGIIVQHLPKGEAGTTRNLGEDTKEEWARATAFLESVKPEELLGVNVTSENLLFRLFHEDGVRVFDPLVVRRGCRCSQEKLTDVIRQFSEDDIEHMAENGMVEMTCEFCNKTFAIHI